jgi:hypothetical protein
MAMDLDPMVALYVTCIVAFVGGLTLIVTGTLQRIQQQRLEVERRRRRSEAMLHAIQEREARGIEAGDRRRMLLDSRGRARQYHANLTNAMRARSRY